MIKPGFKNLSSILWKCLIYFNTAYAHSALFTYTSSTIVSYSSEEHRGIVGNHSLVASRSRLGQTWTVSRDVTERDPSQSSCGRRGKRERLGIRLRKPGQYMFT